MNINCKVQILSLWDLWSCWYRWVSVGNTVFSSRQSPFIIFHWSLVTLRTFQGYVFEEPWCSSSKGQPIYVVSNAKPNELLIVAEFFASIHKSTFTYSCPHPPPPSHPFWLHVPPTSIYTCCCCTITTTFMPVPRSPYTCCTSNAEGLGCRF